MVSEEQKARIKMIVRDLNGSDYSDYLDCVLHQLYFYGECSDVLRAAESFKWSASSTRQRSQRYRDPRYSVVDD